MIRVKISGSAVPGLPQSDNMTEEKYRKWSDFCGRVYPLHKVLCVVNDKLVFIIEDESDFEKAKSDYKKANFFSVPEKQIPT